MDKTGTLIALVVDRSGSMDHLQIETISGVNKLIAEQQATPGECDFTLVQFSTDYEFTYNAVPVRDVKPLTVETYKPAGYTALLDAVGRCIDETGKRLAAMPDGHRPGKVIVVIITDGMENASTEYARHVVVAKIEHQKVKYGWQFVFMGATLGAVEAARGMGIGGQSVAKYAASPVGVRASYAVVSAKLVDNRLGNAVSMDWSPVERNAVDPGPDKP